jgi:hypothetical protein
LPVCGKERIRQIDFCARHLGGRVVEIVGGGSFRDFCPYFCLFSKTAFAATDFKTHAQYLAEQALHPRSVGEVS